MLIKSHHHSKHPILQLRRQSNSWISESPSQEPQEKVTLGQASGLSQNSIPKFRSTKTNFNLLQRCIQVAGAQIGGLFESLQVFLDRPLSDAAIDAVDLSQGLKTKSMKEEYRGEQHSQTGKTITDPDYDAVLYLNPEERHQYKLEIRDGLLYTQEGTLFDTGDSKTSHGGQGKAMIVQDGKGEWYASKDQISGLFHHSSFLAGGDLAFAGEVGASGGVLHHLSTKSGHYQPEPEFMTQALASLKSEGVNIQGVDKVLARRRRPKFRDIFGP